MRSPITSGNIYRQAGQYDMALTDYNRAIAIDRHNAEAYHNRGLVQQAQNQHMFAIEDFNRAIAADANATPPRIARGMS